MDFDGFRRIYPLRPYPAERIRNEGELHQLTAEAGLMSFPRDAMRCELSQPPRSQSARGKLYLWVIAANDVSFALESVPYGQILETGVIKHTNLTGGADAHSGGELWFLTESRLLLSAASGRYGPKSEQEMIDAALAFKNEGFEVASLGFDDDTGYPCQLLVGEPKWI